MEKWVVFVGGEQIGLVFLAEIVKGLLNSRIRDGLRCRRAGDEHEADDKGGCHAADDSPHQAAEERPAGTQAVEIGLYCLPDVGFELLEETVRDSIWQTLSYVSEVGFFMRSVIFT